MCNVTIFVYFNFTYYNIGLELSNNIQKQSGEIFLSKTKHEVRFKWEVEAQNKASNSEFLSINQLDWGKANYNLNVIFPSWFLRRDFCAANNTQLCSRPVKRCSWCANVNTMHRTLCTARARLRSVLVACTGRARSSMHHKWIKDMFPKSANYFLNLKNSSSQFWEHFWKKYFFHPRVPPLVFGHYVRTDLVEVGGKFEDSNF